MAAWEAEALEMRPAHRIESRLNPIERVFVFALFLVCAVSTVGCVGTTKKISPLANQTTSSANQTPPPAVSNPQISISTVSLDFGNVTLGATGTLQVTFANTGNENVLLSQQAVNGAGFSSEGIGSNMTLTASQSATLSVTFSPTSTGTTIGSVVLSSNATSLPIVIALAGAGQNAHSVTLGWSPSTSTVIGYFVYRGASSDGPWMRLSASIDTVLSYTDSTVQAGQLYFYAVSSVDSEDLESALSDAVSVLIPSP